MTWIFLRCVVWYTGTNFLKQPAASVLRVDKVSSTLKMEATSSSETLAPTHWTTRIIPHATITLIWKEHCHIYLHSYNNLKHTVFHGYSHNRMSLSVSCRSNNKAIKQSDKHSTAYIYMIFLHIPLNIQHIKVIYKLNIVTAYNFVSQSLTYAALVSTGKSDNVKL